MVNDLLQQQLVRAIAPEKQHFHQKHSPTMYSEDTSYGNNSMLVAT